ncbi:TPA: type I toxin-antitoxin system Ibs family toxin [Citrobacter freundii]|nr:type I toxin-antitoxin system Ibs family toxin [Citrobacter freundii]EIN8655883.1 type I toxin-antitoxin system Ibs family toxin [Citrobacter freundii]HBZ9065951.1 type I toxin-antitoxin system Ibs family toxin [Citrobacter freundii]HBZ9264075.1 type I toxin-antitoxin system Ibs family toxin [Citrobacter freundii]HBZ9381623.1 type I toxin-antitoxin system Ibs family toxin [Citrobacter freundii]HBZ9645145.1 type I toxin-antitoxin system Ibs family toxin [Citrobacter freundii]
MMKYVIILVILLVISVPAY